MRKDLGKQTIVAPLPVLIVATYDENDTPNAMNVAWGGQCASNCIAINLSPHKTTENIKIKQAFTVSFATKKLLAESDYFGIVSGSKENKIEKAGMHAVKSKHVDAPIIEEFPLTMECKVVSMRDELGETRVVGEIINATVDEAYIGADGKVDLGKMELLAFDSVASAYRIVGEQVGKAWNAGAGLANK